MRAFFAASVLTLLGVAVGSVAFADESRWAAPTFLFWLVVVAASLCVVAAVYVARARSGDLTQAEKRRK